MTTLPRTIPLLIHDGAAPPIPAPPCGCRHVESRRLLGWPGRAYALALIHDRSCRPQQPVEALAAVIA